MAKRKGTLITKTAIRQFFMFVTVFLLGFMIALVLSMSLQLYQLTRTVAKIENYLGRAFPVEPESIREMAFEIQLLPWVTDREANLYAMHICFGAELNGVDPQLIYWLAYYESRFKKRAVSEKDCLGLMQLNPKIFKEYTVEELQNPKMNIGLGIAHFADCKRRARGDKAFAVRLWHGNPHDPASIELSRRVMKKYREEI